jgi:hypothetical protein
MAVYDMIGFRIQGIMTIRDMDGPAGGGRDTRTY